MSQKLGFIGLGLMGANMAERLLDLGFDLVVHNRSAEKARPLAERGAQVAASPEEVGRTADWIGLMLLDAHAVEAVLEGGGLLATLGPGHTVANFSTVGVEPAERLEKTITATGARYLDCPVLGSTAPAREGRLLVFASGDPTAFEASRPMLEALSDRIFDFGPTGRASGMKLIANMLLARFTEALGEMIALARGFGLPPEQVVEVLQASALASPMWNKAATVLKGPAPVHFPLSHMSKDLRLLDEEIERLGLCLPAHQAVFESYQEAEQEGLGGFDYSDIVRLFDGGEREQGTNGPE